MPFSNHTLAEESSIPALKHIFNSKSRWRQIFWTIALLISLGLLVFHAVRLTQNYLAYPTSVQYRSLQNDTFIVPLIFITFTNWVQISITERCEYDDSTSSWDKIQNCPFQSFWTNASLNSSKRPSFVLKFNSSFAANSSYMTENTLRAIERIPRIRQTFRALAHIDGHPIDTKGYMNFVWPEKATWQPKFGNSGVEVKTTGITKVTLSYLEEEKLPYPYSTCVSEYPPIFERVQGMEYAQIPYSRRLCYLMCAASLSQQPRFWPETFGYRFNGSKMPANLNISNFHNLQVFYGEPYERGPDVYWNLCHGLQSSYEKCYYEWLLIGRDFASDWENNFASERGYSSYGSFPCDDYCSAPECKFRQYHSVQTVYESGESTSKGDFEIRISVDPHITYVGETAAYCSINHHTNAINRFCLTSGKRIVIKKKLYLSTQTLVILRVERLDRRRVDGGVECSMK